MTRYPRIIVYDHQQNILGLATITVSVFLLCVAALAFFRGWVIHIMWNWFIPSIFPSLPYLSVGEGIALSLVVSIFDSNQRLIEMNETEKEHPVLAMFAPFIWVGTSVVLGYIVQWLVF